MPRSESVKKKALEVVEGLPAKSDWGDILYELYVRKKIETGIAAADAGQGVAHDEVRKRFLKRR